VLKKFSQNIIDLLSVTRKLLKIKNPRSSVFKRKRWNNVKTEEYELLLEAIGPVLDDGNEFQFGADLNYGFYNMTHKFII